ncbi:hypothetical protein [Corynebacterium sp.]|uniref:hypothetical protein n=1 Tax=Corynebacterium sp. TaxID=1720 RepID=UPI0026DB8E1F|nr:hypothetical protein [Corynebacterium sp.]MDO5032283.1 hypothetical protein [Corynebacterium sp.]
MAAVMPCVAGLPVSENMRVEGATLAIRPLAEVCLSSDRVLDVKASEGLISPSDGGKNQPGFEKLSVPFPRIEAVKIAKCHVLVT